MGFLELDRRIRVVVAANFLAVAARMSLVTFLGIYFVRVAGISLATVGVAFLIESLLRGTLAPMFGALSDRIGRRWLLLAAALTTAVVLPCFLLVSGPASLFAWSTAMGIAGAVNMPVASALLLDLAPPERRQAVLAVNYTGMSVAYTLGVMPAGYVAEQGYVLLGAISSIGYLLVAALYAVALRGALPLERARTEARLLTDMLSVTRDRLFLGFAALAFIFPLAMGQVVTVSPLFAADEGLGEGYIGLVLGGNSIIVALLAVPVATRMEASGPFRLLGLAACLVSAAFCCYAMLPDAAAALLLGTVIFSFGELVFSSAVPAAVARLAPPGRRGAYQGGWTLIASLSMGSALFLSGLLRDAIGWRGAWLTYAVLALALAAMLFVTRDRFLKAQNE
ncbi:MAG TPA: MFS transporter [Burkholderiales bacterium]|nr:MFS transporter [Burkholderiales bacterium]